MGCGTGPWSPGDCGLLSLRGRLSDVPGETSRYVSYDAPRRRSLQCLLDVGLEGGGRGEYRV